MIPELQDLIRMIRLPRPGFYSSDGMRVIVPASTTAKAVVKVGSSLYVNEADVQIHKDVVGEGGLDTGALVANTPYYLYAMPASSGIGFGLVASATDPDSGGPVNFANWSYLGSFPSDDGSATVLSCRYQNGCLLADDAIEGEAHTGGTTANQETFASLPVTATAAFINLYHDGAGAVESYVVAIGASSTTAGAIIVRSQVANVTNHVFGWCPIFTPQTFWLRLSDAATTGSANLNGWQEDLSLYP